jgi:hypothetical protein
MVPSSKSVEFLRLLEGEKMNLIRKAGSKETRYESRSVFSRHGGIRRDKNAESGKAQNENDQRAQLRNQGGEGPGRRDAGGQGCPRSFWVTFFSPNGLAEGTKLVSVFDFTEA